MNRIWFSGLALTLFLLSFSAVASAAASDCSARQEFALVAHGGAGSWDEASPAWRRVVGGMVQEVLSQARQQLAAGAHALDVVQWTVMRFENSGMLNAGKGGVRNRDNVVELDASLMEGYMLRAGAVAGVQRLKNPIAAARLIMDQSPHVLMIGQGAEDFASGLGATLIDPATYFEPFPREVLSAGTVGAVATDRCGHVAAATSTGGLKGKLPGRVGDSALIGAGTYADNRSAAISATGTGEYFIRLGVARDIAALIEYRGLTLQQAAHTEIHDKLAALGGTGGVIAVNVAGDVAMPFNTRGMLRAVVRPQGEIQVLFD